MSVPESNRQEPDLRSLAQADASTTTALGTLGWVGVVVVLALVALALLSALGPVGGR